VANKLITLTIEGLVSDDGHVRLNDFVKQLRALEDLLKIGEKIFSNSVESYYRVVDLRHSSPATIVVEQVIVKPGSLQSPVIKSVLAAIKEVADEGVLDAYPELLRPMSKLARPVGYRLRSSTLSSNGQATSFTAKLASKIDRMLEPEVSEFGEVKGRLERINFHASANRFHIYSDVGPRRVACKFPPRLTDQAERAVNKMITVEGELRYKASDAFPYSVEVQRIAMPPDKAKPVLLSELRGSAPKATGKLSSVEFVWGTRDEW
jgi:hypothetical protein